MKKRKYVIYKRGRSLQLGRVVSKSKDAVVVSDDSFGNIPHFKKIEEVPAEDIVLDLGSNPHPGRVYGKDLSNIYLGTKKVGSLGQVAFFGKPTKKAVKNLALASSVVYKRLKKYKIEELLNHNVYWHVVNTLPGKYAGKYEVIVKQGTKTEIITFTLNGYDASDYAYILTHELGHVAHYNYIMAETGLEAAWLAMYAKSKQSKIINNADCERLLKLVLNDSERPSLNIKLLEEDDKVLLKQILKQIKRIHNLTIKELDALWFGNKSEHIEEVWAKVVPYVEDSPVLNEYALKNHKELFAESFAFYIGGTKLPTRLQKLMDRSMRVLRRDLK